MDLNSNNQIKTDMLLWHDMTAGKYRMMDPGGTLYDCDSNGFKQAKWLPKISAFAKYQDRVKLAIKDRVSGRRDDNDNLGLKVPAQGARPAARGGALQVLRQKQQPTDGTAEARGGREEAQRAQGGGRAQGTQG